MPKEHSTQHKLDFIRCDLNNNTLSCTVTTSCLVVKKSHDMDMICLLLAKVLKGADFERLQQLKRHLVDISTTIHVSMQFIVVTPN